MRYLGRGRCSAPLPILPALKNSPPLGAGLGVEEMRVCEYPKKKVIDKALPNLLQ